MKAYILIHIRTGEINAAVRQLQAVPGVREASPTFGPYDAIAVVETDDIRVLGRIVNMEIQTIPGVTETLTCLAME